MYKVHVYRYILDAGSLCLSLRVRNADSRMYISGHDVEPAAAAAAVDLRDAPRKTYSSLAS